MFAKDRLMLLAVFSLVFVSGCLGFGGPRGPAGPTMLGVVETDFSPDLADVQGGDSVILTLEVENNGGSEARDVVAFLYNIPLGTSSESFRLVSGQNPKLLASSLAGPDEKAKLRGEVEVADWGLRAPDLPEGTTIDYDPKARILYRYKTAATSTVSVLTTAEHRRLRERNEPIPGQTETLVTKGPLTVTIDAGAPVIIRDDTSRMRLVVRAEVAQTGSVFDPDYTDYITNGSVPTERLDKARVRVFAPGVTASPEECQQLTNDVTMTFRGGTEMSFSCELKPSSFVGRSDIPVRVEITYNFLKDATTRISVTGTRRAPPTGGGVSGQCSEQTGTACPAGQTNVGCEHLIPSPGKVWCRPTG